jgi:hypothetical protein
MNCRAAARDSRSSRLRSSDPRAGGGQIGPYALAVSVLESEWLRKHVDACIALYLEEFKLARKALPPAFELDWSDRDFPVFVKQPGQGAEGTKILLVLKSDSNQEWSLRLQVGHEIFHWLFTPPEVHPGIYHWSHEMLANEMSICCIRASGVEGAEAYAQATEQHFRDQAAGVSLRKMLTTPLRREGGAGYSWVFGRAFVVGRCLIEKVGWEHVKGLATSLDDQHQPDVRGWIDALPRSEQLGARDVLGAPHEKWV